jgi:Fe-S-cluster-containing dehydrogenase component/DMSO reductase anchor subunit
MRKGFIFDHNKCVNCNACRATCILENGWKVHPRNVYTFNSEAEYLLPVINLSLACNHCEKALCMSGCPASAISRDMATNAIIVDETKCIGCKYCQWNCPYDAPKYDLEKRTIAKCNLCYTGLANGLQPACSSACPTGALRFDKLSEKEYGISYSWFPDKKLKPAIEFTASIKNTPARIIPEKRFKETVPIPEKALKKINEELSLIIFSFLAAISVSILIFSFVKGIYPAHNIFIPVLLLTGFISMFHLGKKLRSWRSIVNFRNSPLSREITALILYSVIALTMSIVHIPGLLIASTISGLILLFLIDNVYYYADKRESVVLHSGQTFITALLIGSFLSGMVLPFVFIALIKLIAAVYNLLKNRNKQTLFELRFIRIAFLIVPGISLISHISYPELPVILMFLTGEFLDRILFYIDFNPMNINQIIEEQLNKELNEKKRG